MWRLSAPVVLLTLVSGVAGAATFTPRDEAPAGVIAFESDRAGAFDVYVANADGSGAHRITHTGGESPAWSPDGRRIAFLRAGTIVSADADGTVVHQVATGEDLAWSPDGTQLVFEHNWDIDVVNADGTGLQRLTRTARRADVNTLSALPSWSPDGTKIAFERFSGLYEIDVTTAKLSRLSAWGVDPSSNARPRWSPDGTAIAFRGDCRNCATGGADGVLFKPGGVDALRVVELDTGKERTVAKGTGDTFAWSPDGSTIAYARPADAKGGAPWEIYTTPAGAGTPTRVTTSLTGESSVAPKWSPDGAWIVYLHNRFPESWNADSWDVDVIRPDGSGRAELTGPFPTGGTNAQPVWARGSIVPQPAIPLTRTPSRTAPLSNVHSYDEVAAEGSRAALISSASGTPMFWRPGASHPSHTATTEFGAGAYGLVMAGTHAAWLCNFVHGFSPGPTSPCS